MSKKTPKSAGSAATVERSKWGNKVQFILSCVGYSVGLGNVWRFSALAYKNGGGAFLIPYLISVALSGLPLYVLELALGQFGSLGPTTVFRRMTPMFQGLGWGTVIISFNVAMYYNVIIAWVIYYLAMSFRKDLLWEDCGHTWNTWKCTSIINTEKCRKELKDPSARYFAGQCFNSTFLNDSSYDGKLFSDIFNASLRDWNKIKDREVNWTVANTFTRNMKNLWLSAAEEFYCYSILEVTDDTGFQNLGRINWPLLGCLFGAWALVFFCLWGGVQTSGKVVYFTALFPYLVLFITLVRGSLLDGAGTGIKYYVDPQTKYLADPQVWRRAAVQVFFSLGPAQGGLITLASYNEFDNNFIRDALIVTIIDSLTSTFAGFTTFSLVGHVAHTLNQPISEAVKDGPGLAFVVFPTAITNMPGAQFFAVLFFLMLITLGLDSEFVLYETVTTAVVDQFPALAKRKTIVVLTGCVICFLLGVPFCTQGGTEIFQIYDDYTSGYALLILAIYQTVVVCWVYGLGRFLRDIECMRGKIINYYWRITWAAITPLYMFGIFVGTMITLERSTVRGKILPDGAQQFGWFLSCMPLMFLLAFGVFRMVEAFVKKQPWSSLITATPHWCPAADLLKRTPGRHVGPARTHLLDHPHATGEEPATASSSESTLKNRKSVSSSSELL